MAVKRVSRAKLPLLSSSAGKPFMAKPLVDDLDRHIGQRLKKLRQQEGVSAQLLAEAIDSTQQQISRYENAHNKLSATQLYRVATALGVPISWFYQDYHLYA